MAAADARFFAEIKRGGIMDGKFEQPRRSLASSVRRRGNSTPTRRRAPHYRCSSFLSGPRPGRGGGRHLRRARRGKRGARLLRAARRQQHTVSASVWSGAEHPESVKSSPREPRLSTAVVCQQRECFSTARSRCTSLRSPRARARSGTGDALFRAVPGLATGRRRRPGVGPSVSPSVRPSDSSVA